MSGSSKSWDRWTSSTAHLVDTKEYPQDVDVVLVEGAVSSEEDAEKILKIRKRTKILVSLGDCAVTSNVPSMRNRFKLEEVEHRAYVENAQNNHARPQTGHSKTVPTLPPGS